MKLRKILFVFLGLALLSGYMAAGLAVQEQRQGRMHRFQFDGLNLPPLALQALAGEFKGLAADYLLLGVQSFIGSNQVLDRAEWLAVARAFDQAQALDPYFEQTYLMAQGLLAWSASMPERAVRILRKAAEHRPWDWRARYYAGFNQYYFLNDYQAASESFLQAAKVPHSPEILPVLGARLAQKSGRTEWALRLLYAMLKEKETEGSRTDEIERRIKALEGVLVLERSVADFKNRTGAWPQELEDLMSEGVLVAFPENPYGTEWLFNPETGAVSFDRVEIRVSTVHGPGFEVNDQGGSSLGRFSSWTPILDEVRASVRNGNTN
ncbi:MAG: hypothetical protein EOM25_01325 [Deltaproteobacteria bacterium]|nr:hypothetical protein [Deltaproteobacteria bacterium]